MNRPSPTLPTPTGSVLASRFSSGGDASLSPALAAVAITGLLLRLALAIFGGNAMRTPWGGGGDTPSYILLAQNLLSGKGYAYAGMPTALRPPAYPVLLAAAFKLFGSHALAAVRCVQFFEGLAVALLCAEAAARLFGKNARGAALAVALVFPTLVEMNGEILSEATSALFAAIFLYFLAGYLAQRSWAQVVGMGCAIGLGSLVRFNMAALGAVALVAVFSRPRSPAVSESVASARAKVYDWKGWSQAATVFIVAVLFVSPWVIRNLIVFRGEVLFSTEGGADALYGVVTPQGRALPGDSAMLRAAVGWVPPTDVETNDHSRLTLGPEPELDAQCRRAAMAIATSKGWGLIPLALAKISDFWLSTDQLFWTSSFSWGNRLVRAGGVLLYWALLGLAGAGWFCLRSRNPEAARIMFFYAVLITAMHLPFVMSTRLRMPLIDPMLAVLAAGGLARVAAGFGPASKSAPAE